MLQALRRQDREALASFQESATLAQDAGLPLVPITAQINAARAELRLGEPQSSCLFLDHAFEQIRELPPSHDKAVGLINIGLGYGQLPALLPDISAPLLLRAAGVLQESVTLSEQLGDMRSLSYGLGYLGHLYETEYRTDEALRLTRRAVFAPQSAGSPESLYRWQWQLGRLQASSRHLDEAIASYRQAAATLQPIRPEVARASYDASSQSQESVLPLFVELADLLLQRAGLTKDPREPDSVLEAVKAVPGVLAAHPRGGHDGAVVVDVEAEAGRDVRSELAWAVVTKGHGLLGLQQMGMSLEEIFLHLTTTHAAEQAPAA